MQAIADLLRRLFRAREAGVSVFLVMALVAAAILAPRFYSLQNLRNLLLDTPLVVTVGMGMTAVIVCRQIDLSVGSIVAVSGMAVGEIYRAHPSMPTPIAMAVGVAVGALLGLGNALLVTYLNVPSIITTLGTMSIYRGLAFVIGGGRQINPNDLPAHLVSLSISSPVGIPYLALLALVIFLLTHVFLSMSRMGRAIYATGSNPDAARLSGLPTEGIVAGAFIACGALAGLAGIMYASRFGFVNPAQTGNGFELQVIAATVIGGTQVTGGSGTAVGTLLGCILLAAIVNILTVAHLSGRWQLAAYGAIILVAIVSDGAGRLQSTPVVS